MTLHSPATLSSLTAQSQALAVSAANVANVRSVGLRTDGQGSGTPPFVPQRSVQVSGPNNEVRSRTLPVQPPSVLAFEPGDPEADADGLVARPNVALEQELVLQLQLKAAYKANLAALETQDEMLGSLLDMMS